MHHATATLARDRSGTTSCSCHAPHRAGTAPPPVSAERGGLPPLPWARWAGATPPRAAGASHVLRRTTCGRMDGCSTGQWVRERWVSALARSWRLRSARGGRGMVRPRPAASARPRRAGSFIGPDRHRWTAVTCVPPPGRGRHAPTHRHAVRRRCSKPNAGRRTQGLA